MDRLPLTRHSLLLRLADARDAEAWSEFVAVYESAVFRFACSRGLQRADAEDVTQKVLQAVLAKAPIWDRTSGGSFGAWLFRVTRNLAAKTWNAQNDRDVHWSKEEDSNWLEAIPSPSDEEKTLFQMEYRKALFHWAADRVRGHFQSETWSAFWMNSVDQVDASVVAEQLGMTKSTVYVAKCRVMKRIRDEIERFEQEFSHHNTIE